LTSDLGPLGRAGSAACDVEPGLRVWSESPLYGNGIGTQVTTGESGAAQTADRAQGAVIFFDNEWLNTLVSLGVLGVSGRPGSSSGAAVVGGSPQVRGPGDLAAASPPPSGVSISSSTRSRSSVDDPLRHRARPQARRLRPPTDS
jgi:hypothetical protein